VFAAEHIAVGNLSNQLVGTIVFIQRRKRFGLPRGIPAENHAVHRAANQIIGEGHEVEAIGIAFRHHP